MLAIFLRIENQVFQCLISHSNEASVLHFETFKLCFLIRFLYLKEEIT